MGFSTNSIRDLNKIEIFYIQSEVNKSTNERVETREPKLFLYTTQGWDYNFSIDTGSSLFDTAKNLVKSPLLALGFTAVTGASTVIDMERKYAFSGSNPLQFTVNGFRVLENSPEEDIYKPINTLLGWLLPKRSSEVFDTFSSLFKSEESSGLGVENIIQKVISKANEVIGDIYTLTPPDQFNLDSNNKMAVKLGGQFIRNVFIKSISIRTPKFYYAQEDGNPIPDRVDFSITFETLRSAIKDDYIFGR